MARAVGGVWTTSSTPKHPDAKTLSYYAYDSQKLEHLLDNPKAIRTPIVRNGKQATVGYCPDVWKGWE